MLKSSIYCCYISIEPHQQPHHPLIFYLFFLLFKLLLSLFFIKKKTILHYISPYLLLRFLQLFPFLFCLFISHYFYFTITLLSSFSLSYIMILFLPFLFCINSIPFLLSNPYFSYKKTEYSLSLSTFFWWILFFLITLIKFDVFYLFIFFL